VITPFRTLLLLTLLIPAGCASTFVASKDGKGYYLGSSSGAAYTLFCESGDLRRILNSATKLRQEMKDDLYSSNCGTERSNEQVQRIYATMTSEQRKDLRLAFKQNGYDINIMRC
jgi:hypothetical protein